MQNVLHIWTRHPGAIVRIPLRRKSKLSKVPNLRQPSTGPTIYKPMVLPPVQQIPLQPTIAPVRPAPAPLIPANGPSKPLGPMTNTPNQVRK